jgi:PAS domain-containing protein
MKQHPIELILMRQLAGYLAVPVFLVDAEGTLLFYNEPAEALLGRRFDEAGEMPLEHWATAFHPTDERGRPLSPAELPLVVALRERRPMQRAFWIEGLDGVRRRLEVVALPLVGQGDRFLGGMAAFWESGP